MCQQHHSNPPVTTHRIFGITLSPLNNMQKILAAKGRFHHPKHLGPYGKSPSGGEALFEKRMAAMKTVGAHVSAAGGLDKASENAAKIGARAFALFTRHQRRWDVKPLSEEEIEAFRENCRRLGYGPTEILAHDSYLINLGHPETALLAKSRRTFAAGMRRCEALDIALMDFHPGTLRSCQRPCWNGRFNGVPSKIDTPHPTHDRRYPLPFPTIVPLLCYTGRQRPRP